MCVVVCVSFERVQIVCRGVRQFWEGSDCVLWCASVLGGFRLCVAVCVSFGRVQIVCCGVCHLGRAVVGVSALLTDRQIKRDR